MKYFDLAAIAAMCLATGGQSIGHNSRQDLKPEDIDVTPKEKPIPKGCKRYYFNDIGGCYKGSHKISFDAMTAKKAYEKFNKWQTKITTP